MVSATAASFQVIEELLRTSFLNARDRQVSWGDPMEKVFRCPNMLPRCHPLITAMGQFFGEAFKQMTTWVTAQFLITLSVIGLAVRRHDPQNSARFVPGWLPDIPPR
jgi:hypothetical protein